MNWYIGQEIVCVNAQAKKSLIRGRTYLIKGLRKSFCNCGHTIIDVGIPFDYSTFTAMRCDYCGFVYNSGGVSWCHESRFAPLDQDISELTEILEKEATR